MKMSRHIDWDRVAELLEQARRIDADARDEWLDAQCGDDAVLRAEIASLIETAADSDGYLDGLAESVLAPAVHEMLTDRPDVGAVDLCGRRLGVYEVLEVIGTGATATVYLSRDTRHNRTVAIKVLRPELAAWLGPDRFLREIEIAAGLVHPHILPVFDSGEADGRLYYVMPHIDGESLRRRLERERRLTVEETIRLTQQVASALTYAHERGIVHRDIKPENILMAGDQAVVADFGIARALEMGGGERLTATGLAMGTPTYMSPEQALGNDEVDARADVYALGCVVHEMVVGSPPFTAPTPQALVAKHATARVPAMRASDPAIPVFVERAVECALAKDRDDRFATAAAFADVLSTGRIVARAPRRRSMRRVAAILAGLTVAGLAGWNVSSAVRGPSMDRLAVLPLTSLAMDAGDDYLVQGVHEALISELAQLRIPVIARATMQQYGNGGKSIREIARELGVDGVIEGSVFRDGELVGITARLYDGGTEREVWSGSYDGDLPNVAALYRGFTRAIADAIRLRVRPEDAARLAEKPAVDPAVYEAYLRGMYHLNQSTPEHFATAIGYFDQAVSQNPADALANAGLAFAHVTLGHGPAPPPDAWRRARAAAERAIRLDPQLAEGWAVMADVKTYFEWDWENAEQAFERASVLNPSLPMNHYHHAWYHVLHGRVEEALTAHRRAQQLDPLTPLHTVWIPGIYLYSGQPGRALSEARRLLADYPENGALLYVLGTSAAQVGEYDEAIAAHERAVAVNPGWRGALGRTYALAGRTADARRIAAELEAEPSAWNALGLADLHTALGNYDEAFRWLDYEPAHGWLPWSRVNPALEPLRDDPRFMALLRRMDLEP
ncbi:MAG: protein kinase [Gemmatimonadetes bacterium]|nr:protein kinase [Gemmatimonadota bacterium]